MKLFTANRLILGILAVAGFYFASVVLIPLVVSIFIALLLDPVVVRLEEKGISRLFGTSLTLFLFLSSMFIGGVAIYQTVSRAMDQAPQYMLQMKKITTQIKTRTEIFHSHESVTEKNIQKVEVVDNGSALGTALLHMMGSVFEIISIALFVPLLSFYFLLEKADLLESFHSLTGSVFFLPKLNTDLPNMIQAFVKGNIVGAALMITLHAAVFQLLGLQNSLGLAFVTGFLNLIPLVGAVLALLFPIAQALLQWADFWPYVILVVSIVSFHFVVGNIVLPQLIGPRIDVNAASLIFGLLFWGWLWGAMGFLLAIPLTATLKILLECNDNTRAIANLFAAKPKYVRISAHSPV